MFCFVLAASGKLHHRVSVFPDRLSQIFTRHALPSPHREPGSFSGATQTLLPADAGATLFRRRASCAARSRIAIDFFFARGHWLFRQQPVQALLRAFAHCILDDSVFERVKADYHQPSARLQHAGAPPPAVLSDRPVHGLRRFGEPERYGSPDECAQACFIDRAAADITSTSCFVVVSAATGQWLWRFSATSFPHRIRKSHRPARARRCGLPLVRRSSPDIGFIRMSSGPSA